MEDPLSLAEGSVAIEANFASGKKNSTCSLCEMKFNQIEDLNNHILVHENEAPFECPDCAEVFEEFQRYLDHVAEYHSEIDQSNLETVDLVDRYECPPSITKFVLEKDHELHKNDQHTTTNKPLTSKLDTIEKCDDRKLAPLDWQKRDNKERLFECNICSRSFTLASTLSLHNRRIHLNIKPYQCTVCQMNFAQSSDLIRHMRKHTNKRPYKCTYCNMTFTQNRNMKNHMKMHQEDPSVCKYCKKVFAIDTSLVQHLKKHEGPHAKECEFCNIPYSKDSDLLLHKKREHSDGKHHKCPVCCKAFAKSCDLNKHKRIHSNEKPYKCLICLKAFTHPTSLRNHKAVHTNEKPFQCSFCGKSFAFSGNLKVHIRCHTNEKPFTCNFCGKSFARTANLNEHLKIHTGEKNHKCDICGKAFTNSSTFSKHKKIHTGQRAHKCTVCDKTFIQRAHLGKHLKIHTGEKPYECKICNRFFRRTDTLASHMKTHKNTGSELKEDANMLLNNGLSIQEETPVTNFPTADGPISEIQISLRNSDGSSIEIQPNINYSISNGPDQQPVTMISYQQLLQWSNSIN